MYRCNCQTNIENAIGEFLIGRTGLDEKFENPWATDIGPKEAIIRLVIGVVIIAILAAINFPY